MAITEITNINDAIDAIISGVVYFLKHHTKKTVIVLMLICGSMIYVVFDYLTSDKITVEKLKPLTSNISIFPEIYADEKRGKDAIIINSKYYGEADTNYIIYKIKNSNELIIYNKQSQSGYRYEIPALEDFKQQRKK